MDPKDAPGRTDYARLGERLGPGQLRRRICRQAWLWTEDNNQGRGLFGLQGVIPLYDLIAAGLRCAGLYARARAEFLDIRIERIEWYFPGLPEAFDGFRLLQLSDLHCDLDPAFTPTLLSRLEGVDFDHFVVTGDFHNKVASDPVRSLAEMGEILRALGPRGCGVLGNHDFLEKVAFLEAHGLPILLNEWMSIERAGQKIYLCGVDDPHFFETHDLARARAGIPPGAFTILLAHSPEIYEEAEALGYDLVLAGHLHGGQLCMPGGIPIVRNADVPDEMVAGRWAYGHLRGYTSRGTGGCGVAVRLNCPPEITVHTLRVGRSR